MQQHCCCPAPHAALGPSWVLKTLCFKVAKARWLAYRQQPPTPCLTAGCPVSDRQSSSQACTSSGSSVEHAARINMPVVDNSSSSSQDSVLDTSRQKSSIPIAASELPKHQDGGADVWMYPSEQQFYNAMRRKVCSCYQSSSDISSCAVGYQHASFAAVLHAPARVAVTALSY